MLGDGAAVLEALIAARAFSRHPPWRDGISQRRQVRPAPPQHQVLDPVFCKGPRT
jgi:hypothetical protein